VLVEEMETILPVSVSASAITGAGVSYSTTTSVVVATTEVEVATEDSSDTPPRLGGVAKFCEPRWWNYHSQFNISSGSSPTRII
jgi:hypothetical protein